MRARLGIRRHLGALAREPRLLWEAIRAFFATRRRRHPLPSSAYLAWRMETAYGTANAAPEPDDVVHYLRWRKHMRRISEDAI